MQYFEQTIAPFCSVPQFLQLFQIAEATRLVTGSHHYVNFSYLCTTSHTSISVSYQYHAYSSIIYDELAGVFKHSVTHSTRLTFAISSINVYNVNFIIDMACYFIKAIILASPRKSCAVISLLFQQTKQVVRVVPYKL